MLEDGIRKELVRQISMSFHNGLIFSPKLKVGVLLLCLHCFWLYFTPRDIDSFVNELRLAFSIQRKNFDTTLEFLGEYYEDFLYPLEMTEKHLSFSGCIEILHNIF